jgi:hypothetical protein
MDNCETFNSWAKNSFDSYTKELKTMAQTQFKYSFIIQTYKSMVLVNITNRIMR